MKVKPAIDGNRFYSHTIATVALCLVIVAAVVQGCAMVPAHVAKVNHGSSASNVSAPAHR